MKILAIDPANVQSGWCIVDTKTYKPLEFGKTPNSELEQMILTMKSDLPDVCVIEEIRSYGQITGQTTFDTCVQIGRFERICEQRDIMWEKIPRKVYTSALLGIPKIKDANVVQYLINRFAPDTPNRGKGSKKEQGWFYGFAQDVWQAYCLAVYVCDRLNKKVW